MICTSFRMSYVPMLKMLYVIKYIFAFSRWMCLSYEKINSERYKKVWIKFLINIIFIQFVRQVFQSLSDCLLTTLKLTFCKDFIRIKNGKLVSRLLNYLYRLTGDGLYQMFRCSDILINLFIIIIDIIRCHEKNIT